VRIDIDTKLLEKKIFFQERQIDSDPDEPSSIARSADQVELVFFPLARLPNPAMTKLLKMLSLGDRKNMRLVSRR
jgi:hypothetical protein